MKVENTNKAETRTLTFITWCLTLALVGTAVIMQRTSGTLQKAAVMADGLSTCFTRVQQSYTAKYVGNVDSNYLDKTFMNDTESCNSEMISYMEKNLQAGLEGALTSLNSFNSDIHWFHKKLQSQPDENTPPQIFINNISGKFEKLEATKDSIAESIDNFRTSTNSWLNKTSYAFYILTIAIPVLMIISLLGQRNRRKAYESIEQEARNEIVENEGTQGGRVDHILTRALDFAQFSSVKELSKRYIARSNYVSGLDNVDASGKMVEFATGTNPEALSAQLDRMWNNDEEQPPEVPVNGPSVAPVTGDDGKEEISLRETITNTIDLLSSKIFTYGVSLDIDIDDEIKVYGSAEYVEQAIYHIIANAIESYDYDDKAKYVTITTRQLGGTVLIDFIDSGNGFNENFLKEQAGLEVEEHSHKNTDLIISKELIEGFNGKICFENVANEDGKVVGAKVQLVLQSVPKTKLVSLKKGKKRDVLKNIAQGINV